MTYIFNINSELKKILLKIIIPYFSIIIIVGLIINYSFEKFIVFQSGISGTYKVNRILNENNKNKIIIIGSSRARGGVIPEIINKNIFNYGIDGTGYNYINFILEEELNKNKKTPIIILFDYEWNTLGIGSTQYYIPNSTHNKINKLFKDRFKFYHYIPFLKYFGLYENNFKFYLNNKINYSKYNNKGGSFELFDNSKKQFDDYVQRRRNSNIKFHEVNFHLMDSLFKSTDRKIIILTLPYHKSYLESITNKPDIVSFTNKFKQYKNILYLNYSNLNFADSMYFNTTHLNYKGAKYISKKIKIDLDSLHILPN